MTKEHKKIIVICGPTGSGKTDLAYQLDSNHEMISVDSRQIYKESKIASAQPEEKHLQKHKYHLINFLDISKPFSAPEFANLAAERIKEIHKKKKIPVLVGGSGFYLQALLKGYNDTKEISIEAKEKTNELFTKWENESNKLWEILQQKDKKSAEKIHPNDKYRIRRALELIFSGQIPSKLKEGKKILPLGSSKYNFLKLYVNWPRELLYKRINERIKLLWDSGFLNEYQNLIKKGYSLKDPGMQSLGYNLLDEYLQKIIDRDSLLEKLARSHRKYAKKQICWFASKKWLTPLNMTDIKQEEIQKKIKEWEEK